MSARILFVTGKGGTGKSTVASALAREAVARGLRARLVHLPSPGQPHADRNATRTDERPARAPADPRDRESGTLRPPDQQNHRHRDPGDPDERTLDPHRDLEGFLTRVLGLSFLARRLQDSRTFSAVAAAAPGLRDLVALTAIAAEARRRRGLVVVDAPASGHSLPMLTAPARVRELAPFGPVAREATNALRVLGDARAFCAVLVTTPEELAITEVKTLHAEVLGAGVRACHVVVNGLWPAYVPPAGGDEIERSGVSADASMHWRRHRRHVELVAALEREVGSSSRIRFAVATAGTAPASADVAAVFDQLDLLALRDGSAP